MKLQQAVDIIANRLSFLEYDCDIDNSRADKEGVFRITCRHISMTIRNKKNTDDYLVTLHNTVTGVSTVVACSNATIENEIVGFVILNS